MDWVASLRSAARAALVFVSAAGVVASTRARHDLFQPQQTFRSGVDVIQLDVSVLDKDRRPVRGLTAADFTVLEEGRPRPVVAFRAIELPPPVTVHAAWQGDVAEDVVTNAPARGRVVAIVMGLPAARASYTDKKRTAAAAEVVNELTPDDLAAVVYPRAYGLRLATQSVHRDSVSVDVARGL
jgi:hypothetical protein